MTPRLHAEARDLVALIAPQVEPGDIDRHNEVFAEFADTWIGLQR